MIIVQYLSEVTSMVINVELEASECLRSLGFTKTRWRSLTTDHVSSLYPDFKGLQS